MSLKIGFSIEAAYLATPESSQLLEQMQSDGCTVIQIHGHSDLIGLELADPDLVRSFDYRTIHLPELHGPRQDRDILKAAKDLGQQVMANCYTLHPTGMESFDWLEEAFGNSLSIENMDWRKAFGKIPADLQRIFDEAPSLKWTFDVNHIKTNDPDMRLADEFYEALADRLANYHLSGFVGENLPHTLLADTHQDEIIAKVTQLDKPIILESIGTADIGRFKEELDYVLPRLVGSNVVDDESHEPELIY